MKKHFLLSLLGFSIWLLSSLFLPFPSFLFSEEQNSPDNVIITVGIGEIRENDLVAARDRAIEDAQKKAIIHAVGSEIPSKIMEDNYRILNERIYLQSQRFIEGFKVISEVPQGDFYRITIRFTLAQDDIRNELKRLGVTKQLHRPPRIMLMIAERDIGQKQFTYWWSYENSAPPLTSIESILKNKFQERGMYVIDRISLLKEISQNKKYSKEVNLPEEAIREYGKLFDVDIVISGNIEIEMVKSEGESGMKSVQANVEAKVLQVESGKVLMVTSSHAPASSTDEISAKVEALKKASGKLLDQMTDLINKQCQVKADSKILSLKVIGLQGFSEFLTLKDELKRRIPEVRGIFQRGISLENSQIDVETTLDIPTFTQMLTSTNFEGFNLHVLGSSPALIELQIVPKSVPSSLKITP
jgi:hypothetical protein